MDRSNLETVKCRKCERELPVSKFSKDRTRPNGLQYWCKDCHKEQKEKVRKPFVREIHNLNVSDEFGYWFSGLSDGEAHFGASMLINKGRRNLVVVFSIGLRIDDIDALNYIKDNLRVGRVLEHHRWKTKTPLQRHQADFTIRRAQQLQEVIVPLFDKYPLRTKKRNDYEIWREIVLKYGWDGTRQRFLAAFRGETRLTEEQWQEVEVLCRKLKDVRKFNGD